LWQPHEVVQTANVTYFNTKQTSYEFFMKKKKTKKVTDPFKELVIALNNKTKYPETAGKGQVKGNDVARIRDYLNEQGSKDA